MKKRHIYKLLSISNDINALRKGKMGRRLLRKWAGKQSGKGLGRLFR